MTSIKKRKDSNKLKVFIIAGARPNLMKISPLIKAIDKHNKFILKFSKNRLCKIEYKLVYTGQHYDNLMSGVFWRDLGLPKADFDLNAGSGSHAAQTARIITSFEKICLKQMPKLVVVVGDVNSTLACSLVAAKLGIKIAHVESGLRSFDRRMPEEINRVVTDHLSDYLFTTEESAYKNLINEGIKKKNIHYVGNVMIDTLNKFKTKALNSDIGCRLNYDVAGSNYALLTLHRPSNVDQQKALKRLISALNLLAKYITIIFPVHPRTEKMLKAFGLHNYYSSHHNKLSTRTHKNKINCIDPLSYLDFIKLLSHANFVLTDSGGIQEEAAILGIPCLTLRENTERPVTIKKGNNTLVGSSRTAIINTSKKYLVNKFRRKVKIKLWDGRAAERIVTILSKMGEKNV